MSIKYYGSGLGSSGLGQLLNGTFELLDVGGDAPWLTSPDGKANGGSPKKYAIKFFNNPQFYKNLQWSDLRQLFGGYNVMAKGPWTGGGSKWAWVWYLGTDQMPPTGVNLQSQTFNLAVPGGSRVISKWIYLPDSTGHGPSTQDLVNAQNSHETFLSRGMTKNCGGSFGSVTPEQAKQLLRFPGLPSSIRQCLSDWVDKGFPTGDAVLRPRPGQQAPTPPPPPAGCIPTALFSSCPFGKKAIVNGPWTCCETSGSTVAVGAAVGVAALLLLLR